MQALDAQTLASNSLDLPRRLTILSSIVNNLLDAVVVVNQDRKIEFANSTAARLLKCSLEKVQEMTAYDVFPDKEEGNPDVHSTIEQILATNGASLGGGGRATVVTSEGARHNVVLIYGTVRGEDGNVSGISLSFRTGGNQNNQAAAAAAAAAAQAATNLAAGAAPAAPAPTPAKSSSAASTFASVSSEMTGDAPPPKAGSVNPIRQKAIKSIESRIDADIRGFAIVLTLGQFDMFRLRYGQANAEKLVRVFSAHMLESLGPQDRLYEWSSRTLLLLLERDSTLDEVRVEITSMCSRRLDYFLDASERSALVTLSAAWNLLPLEDTDTEKVVAQIDSFDRAHTRKR